MILRIDRLVTRGNKIAAIFSDEYGGMKRVREAAQVVIDDGSSPLEDLYFDLKEGSVNGGEVGVKALLTARRR